MTLHHIAGYCLSLLSSESSIISKFSGISFLFLLLTFIIIWLKTFIYKNTLTCINVPTLIRKLSEKYDLNGKIMVIDEPTPRAFCLGFFCPNIYISTGLLKLMNEKEIESIILHEKFHLLSRDTLYIAIFSFAKYLFFLFPVIGDIVKNSLLQREIKADKFAIFILDETKYIKSAFRKLLLRDAYVPLFVSSTPFYTQSFIEERIKILAGEKTSAIRVNKRNILFTFTSLVFILIASFYPIKVVDAHASTEKPHVCSVNHACQQTCSNPE